MKITLGIKYINAQWKTLLLLQFSHRQCEQEASFVRCEDANFELICFLFLYTDSVAV